MEAAAARPPPYLLLASSPVSQTALVSSFARDLLLPLLALVLASVMLFINRQKDLLSARQLLVMLLLFVLPMALMGLFGLNDLWFMPFYYVLVQLIALVGGQYYLRHLDFALGEDLRREPGFVAFLTVIILLLGGGLFQLVFNAFSELDYGLWAMTCLLPFVLPLLFARAYEALLAIPNEIRKVWYYPRNATEVQLENVDYYRLMILAVELRKQPGAEEPAIQVKARTTQDLPFGVWFQKFIDDYNYKFPQSPIQTDSDTGPYGWLFYAVRPSFFRWRRYIDADLSIALNRLDERCVIVAKRVEEV